MLPTLRPGQLCLFLKSKDPNVRTVVLAKTPEREVVKRLYDADGQYLLRGDNREETTDYPVRNGVEIVGKLIWPWPK
jgi:SOS-response transcriptional repressor LexA